MQTEIHSPHTELRLTLLEYNRKKQHKLTIEIMRTFTFKGLFLTAVFMLLGCLSIQAADDGLITNQITIKSYEAGTWSIW